jgi:Ca-activated chloride channel family protein
VTTLARIPAVLLVSGWSLLAPFLQPDAREGREGLRSYDRSEWSDAVDRFGRAREVHPDARYDFDLGAAAYRAGDFTAATEAFGAAARSADLTPGHAEYNLGNARFKEGDLKGALAAYRAALRKNPDDQDARFNYELALRLQQWGEQQQPNQDKGEKSRERNQQKQQSPQGQDNPDSTQAQQGEQQEQEEQRKQDEQKQAQEQAAQQEQGENQRQPAEPERMLTPEQAAQLLNQVTPEERELLEARLKAARRRPAEKDW